MRFVAIAVSVLLIVGLASCGRHDTWTATDEREFLATCLDRALEVEPAIPDGRALWDGTWHGITAVELTGADHERLWTAATAQTDACGEYARGLTRPIPIMRLDTR